MHRREALAALPTIALAGCLSGSDGQSSPEERTPPGGIELLEYTSPEYLPAAAEGRLGAVIRNSGDSQRSGTVALELSPDGEHWDRLVETTYDLGPGEQEIVETTVTTHFVGRLRLRLLPFDRSASVEATDPSLDYGETYELPNGIALTVGEPTAVDAYEYESDSGRETATAPENMNWRLATVTARNEGEDPAIASYRTGFEMMGYDWRGTVEYRAENAYGGGELQPGSSRTGVALFENSHRHVEQPIRLRHPYESGTVGTTWSSP